MTPTDTPIQLGQGYYWQDMVIGQRFVTVRRTVTEADLIGFIGVTGMLEAIFLDAGFEHGAIPGRPVPAALTQSMIEGMLFQTMIQRTGLALLEMSLKALRPVLVGDTIHGIVRVAAVKPTSRGNRAVTTSEVEIYNQRDELVMTYEAKRLQAGRPA